MAICMNFHSGQHLDAGLLTFYKQISGFRYSSVDSHVSKPLQESQNNSNKKNFNYIIKWFSYLSLHKISDRVVYQNSCSIYSNYASYAEVFPCRRIVAQRSFRVSVRMLHKPARMKLGDKWYRTNDSKEWTRGNGLASKICSHSSAQSACVNDWNIQDKK